MVTPEQSAMETSNDNYPPLITPNCWPEQVYDLCCKHEIQIDERGTGDAYNSYACKEVSISNTFKLIP